MVCTSVIASTAHNEYEKNSLNTSAAQSSERCANQHTERMVYVLGVCVRSNWKRLKRFEEFQQQFLNQYP